MTFDRILLNLWRYGRNPKKAIIAYKALRQYKLIANSEFYDEEWVRHQYLSLGADDCDPIFFLLTAEANTVNPSLSFPSQEYAAIHGLAPSQNALAHYERVGKKRGYVVSYSELDHNCGKREGLFTHKKVTPESIQESLKAAESSIRRKLGQGQSLNFVFLVYNASIFPGRPLCDCLLKNQNRSVKIIAIPDIRWPGKTDALRRACLSELRAIYDNQIVVDSSDASAALSAMKTADIVCYSTPYDLSEYLYNVRYSVGKNFLPVYFNYSYIVAQFSIEIFKSYNFLFFWKVFFEHASTMKEYREVTPHGGGNAILSGYIKMDAFVNGASNGAKRKTVIIAPHHSFSGGYNSYLNISNFLEYANFVSSLPKRYPDIDFILRPHPFFRQALSEDCVWGKNKTDSYVESLLKNANFSIYTGPDYFKIFSKSDGIIQDCGSFLAEYFYTGKPQCYLLKDKSVITRAFTRFGQQCLDVCYQAYSENDIDHYLQDVILNGNDPLKDARESFAKEVTINYPHATEAALGIIKHELGMGV